MTAKPRPYHRLPVLAWLLAMMVLPAWARTPPATPSAPVSGVMNIDAAQLTPDYWLARTPARDSVLLPLARIAARNARLLREDASMHDLAALPAPLTKAQISDWINQLAPAPSKPLWDENGKQIAVSTLDGIVANRALDAIPTHSPLRFGLVVQRSALRTFPTALRVFSRRGDTDIDRFQESALFPGDAVVIAHTSRDGRWLFVLSPRYAAWVDASAIAEGSRDTVLGYGERKPYRIITGAKPRTVYTREQPALSELQLDMGLRVPLASLPTDQPVNGQHPYSAWILELPVRHTDGQLAFAPALLPRIEDSQSDYLPLTRANLIRQAFKFLGERYGWGHRFNGRDCSGFVSEVYRSMGLQLPRNTGAQAKSPVFHRQSFASSDNRATRMAAIAALDVGDLIYVPGHVMLVLGKVDGQPWVIHDIHGGSVIDQNGKLRAMALNGVSVTPLLPLHFNQDNDYVDRMTDIVRVSKGT